jgi:hypothetical protein
VIRDAGRHGIYSEGVDLDLDGVLIERTGGDAIHHVSPQMMLVRQLGLPQGTDPRQLAGLLAALTAVPERARKEAIQRTGLFRRLVAAGSDAAVLCTRILELAANPVVQEIISKLMA